MANKVLVIACGALAREIDALKKHHGWQHLHMQCIDARLHNRPELIAERVRAKIVENRKLYAHIYIAYADCGTGGALDKVLAEEGVERLPGVHCYQFFAGHERFAQLADEAPGTFYLTDFLTQHFERLVVRPLGLAKHPQLRDEYFGNYTRLVYLSQREDSKLLAQARAAAAYLELEFEHHHCGYGALESGLAQQMQRRDRGQAHSSLLA